MNALPTLICPETIPHPQTIRQLLLFFGTVFHYQPAEEAPIRQPLLDKEQLVRGYAPAPFGNDLEKFQKLVADLQGHGEEYRSGYLATLSQPPAPAREEGSVRQLLASLGRPIVPEEETDEELWRARLYLRLAELQRQGEEELNHDLARAAAQEKRLLTTLLGEESEEETEFSLTSEPTPPSPATTARLLPAWGQLYLADQSPERPWLLTTANQEAFSLLLEHHSRKGGPEPQKIFTLPLPDINGNEEEFLGLRSRCWQDLAPSRTALTQQLLAIADEANLKTGNLFANELEIGFTAELKIWKEKVAELAGSGRRMKELHFYLLPNTPLPALFAKLGQRPAPTGAGLPRHGVIGLLA